MAQKSSKIEAFEGLRGVMAWWVVLGHISVVVGWKVGMLNRNTLAVDVFILLSGFVIAMLVDRKREPYGPYLVRRAFRIVPLYLAILVASVVLLPITLQAWTGVPFSTVANTNRLELAQAGTDHLLPHLLVHLPLLQGLVPEKVLHGAPWTLIGQAWSVSLEWQFYLVAPLLVWGLRTPKRAAVTVVAMALAIVSSRWFTPAYLGTYIFHFGVGIASYFVMANPATRRFHGALIALFGSAILYKFGPWQTVPLGIWLVVLAGVMGAAGPLKAVAQILSRPWATSLGEISYSVYLVHNLPIVLSVVVLNRFDLSPAAYSALLLVGVLPTTLLLSLLAYRWIEQPGIRFGAALASRQLSRQLA